MATGGQDSSLLGSILEEVTPEVASGRSPGPLFLCKTAKYHFLCAKVCANLGARVLSGARGTNALCIRLNDSGVDSPV